MLFARMNKEYVNEDELAKKIAFSRTISFVNKLYPKENPEVALKPGQLTNQLQYGFESLFESFRSAIEQVLSADYNNELTTQKSYEIVKKYNQMSSYLKNIASMNQLSPDDEEKIKKKFDELRGKLESLKTVAKNNNFIDKEDIIDMVDTINETTKIKKDQYKDVSAKSPEMVENIKEKEKATKEYDYITEKISELTEFLTTPEVRRYTNINQLEDNINELKNQYDNTTFDLINPLDRKSINDLWGKVKETYELTETVITTIATETSRIVKELTKVPAIEFEVDNITANILSDKNIEEKVREWIDQNNQAESAAIFKTFQNTWVKPDPKSVATDPGAFTMGTPFDTSKTGINKPNALGSRPSGRKQDQYEKDMKAYNENEELKKQYQEEQDAYDVAEKIHEKKKKAHDDTLKAYTDDIDKYNAAGLQGKQDTADAKARWDGEYKSKVQEVSDNADLLLQDLDDVKSRFEAEKQKFARSGTPLDQINELGLEAIQKTMSDYEIELKKFPVLAERLLDKFLPPVKAYVPKTPTKKSKPSSMSPSTLTVFNTPKASPLKGAVKPVVIHTTTYATLQEYNTAYKSKFKERPPAGHWAKYKKTGKLEK